MLAVLHDGVKSFRATGAQGRGSRVAWLIKPADLIKFPLFPINHFAHHSITQGLASSFDHQSNISKSLFTYFNRATWFTSP